MRVIVKKRGNSAAVRIPVGVMAAAHLSLDDEVDIREEAGRILIQPIRSPAYDLAELLSGITPENRCDEVDSGAAVGDDSL